MLKKQIFGLEQVLNYRREVEKLQKIQYADAKRSYERAEERLRHDEQHVSVVGQEFVSRQEQGISALEMQLYSDYFIRKKDDLIVQRLEVDGLNTQVNNERDILLEASKDKKILELLKEKKVADHKKMLANKEQAFLDEVALLQNERMSQ